MLTHDLLIATDVDILVKISKKITLPEKAGERLATRKTAGSVRKRLRDGVKQRLLKRHCKGPITKEGSLAEVSLHAEAIPADTSTAVFKSNKLPNRNKALKDLVGPFKSTKISRISKEHRTQKINAFKLKLRVPRALSAAAVEADVAGSSFAFDAHSVSRFIGLHSDCVSESRTREAQSGYIWNGWGANDFF